jgi:hypothetical protein
MPVTTGNLEAENPLLLAGLERAAELADIQVVADRDGATLSLRSAGSGRPHVSLDVAIDFDRVVISVSHQPSPSAWAAIYALLGHLAETVPNHADLRETPANSENAQ